MGARGIPPPPPRPPLPAPHSPAPSPPLSLKAATDPSSSERWPHARSRTSGSGGSWAGGVRAGASERERQRPNLGPGCSRTSSTLVGVGRSPGPFAWTVSALLETSDRRPTAVQALQGKDQGGCFCSLTCCDSYALCKFPGMFRALEDMTPVGRGTICSQ